MSGKHEGSQEMRIAGVASAFPKNYYPQEVIREALKGRWQNKLEKPQLLDKLQTGRIHGTKMP
jgi:hypothetical protein